MSKAPIKKDIGSELREQFGLMTESEFAAMCEANVQTIRRWRSERTGPAPVKLGSTVFYRVPTVMQWLDVMASKSE